MGQKTHPIGFRLGIIKSWTSKWYEEKNYSKWLHEDIRLKSEIKKRLSHAGIAAVDQAAGASGVTADDLQRLDTTLEPHWRALGKRAERLIGENQLSSRCRFVSGNMLSTVPPDGDVYILKSILHDWDNGKCVQILGNVEKVMQPEARLILIERMMPAELEQSIGMTTADLNMLCLNGGGERTEAEFAALLDSAGFELTGVVRLENVFGFCALSCMLKRPAA